MTAESAGNSTPGLAARRGLVGLLVAIGFAWAGHHLHAAPVAVRYTERLEHGFLELRTLEGRTIADGDLSQAAKGGQVTARIVFHFHDGSRHEETAAFTQREHLRLASYRLVQKWPSFPRQLDMSIDAGCGVSTLRAGVADQTDESSMAEPH